MYSRLKFLLSFGKIEGALIRNIYQDPLRGNHGAVTTSRVSSSDLFVSCLLLLVIHSKRRLFARMMSSRDPYPFPRVQNDDNFQGPNYSKVTF